MPFRIILLGLILLSSSAVLGGCGVLPASGPATMDTLTKQNSAAIPYALFIAGGPLLAIPLAVVTALPAAGRALLGIGLGRLPEETAPPPEITALALPAIELSPARRRDA